MITDGEATDKASALEAVVGLNIQILYVGAGIKPAFLDELAAKCGGYCNKQDLTKPKELAAELKLLMAHLMTVPRQ